MMMTVSSPAASARLLLPSASLVPRSLRLPCGAAARRSRRSSGRLGVVRAASAEVAAPDAEAAAAAPSYTSDSLILYFKAEGTMEERAIPKIIQALEGVDGVSDLEVLIEEGIGSVVLTKEMTVQATVVASNLVEAIQGAGFKLQSLSLSFDDFIEDVATVGGEDDDQATE